MKPTALHIERWLDGVEARIVPPERRGLRVIIHEGDDEAAAMEKAVAEHIAAHPEDAGRTVKDFRWVVWEIVRKPQELPQELRRLTLVSSLDRSHGDPCINVLLGRTGEEGTGVGMGEW